MSHTFHAASRATHYRIVAVALFAGIAVTIVGLHGRHASGIEDSHSVAKVHLPVELSNLNPVVVAELR
ncbi:hypothetical protein [Bradyrhizobium sp. USDA 4452]